jgi:Na+-translocating ferredoxin:NAD+ oxidoreductase RnfC subunit
MAEEIEICHVCRDSICNGCNDTRCPYGIKYYQSLQNEQRKVKNKKKEETPAEKKSKRLWRKHLLK